MSPNELESVDMVAAPALEAKVQDPVSHAAEVYERLLKIIPAAEIELESSGEKSRVAPGPVHHCFAMGGYADIFKGVRRPVSGPTKVVAIKVFRGAHLTTISTEVYLKRLRKEYAVWGELEHRNILPLEGLVTHGALPSAGLVSEFKAHGNLADFIKRRDGPECDRILMVQGVACGLEYLHSKGVVHGDLTAANVLVDQDEKTRLFFPLITDFGKSRILEKDGYTTSMNKTPMVARPPELLLVTEDEDATNKEYLTPASDVYSFSLLLLLLVTGKEAYSQEKLTAFAKQGKIVDSLNPLRPVPDLYPILHQSYEFCWGLMGACWKPDKDERITSQEAHKWLCFRSPPSSQNAARN